MSCILFSFSRQPRSDALLLSICLVGAPAMPAVAAGNTIPLAVLADQMRPEISCMMKQLRVPGAVIVMRAPGEEWVEAFGVRNRNGSQGMEPGDQFRIGSITKTWTGTVILQLVQEGKLALSDPISQYVEGVPNGGKITIEHLLQMRSGLFNYTTDKAFQDRLFGHPFKPFDTEHLLKMALARPVYFQPGVAFNYSNTNTLLLGKVIEKLEGVPLAQAFRERLFKPLGLNRSDFPSPHDTSLRSPYARGYTYDADPADKGQAGAAASRQRDASNWTTSWAGASGMGISTAPELALFVERMIKGGYLNESMQAQRMASCLPGSPGGSDYCWAMRRFKNGYHGHTGELPGYSSFMGYNPDDGTTLVVFTSLSYATDGRAPAPLIVDAIQAARQQAR